MTQEQAKEMWPIMRAYAEGQVIQTGGPGNYADAPHSLNFDAWRVDYYRIKPKSMLRQWRPEEAPVGCLVTNDFANASGTRWLLLSSERLGVFIAGRASVISYAELKQYWKYSTDNGKTWLPCGVQE